MNKKAALLAGIGRLGVPVAENLVEKGWKIAVSYRRGHGSEKTVSQLANRLGGDRIVPIEASITETDQAERLVSLAFDSFGKIDALLAIASGYPDEQRDWQRWEEDADIEETDWEFYRSNFFSARNTALALLNKKDNLSEDLNVIFFSDARSLLYMDQKELDPYSRAEGILRMKLATVQKLGLKQLGKIAPQREVNPYTLAKRDLGHLTWKLSLEFQGGRVRVNTIAPGPMIPPPDKTPNQAQSVVDSTILKRWGGTEPIVQAVDFLLDNSFLSGEIIHIDGGFFIHNRFSSS